MNLFDGHIGNWKDWGRIFQSIPAFARLAAYILEAENLPVVRMVNLSPGTNAVFRAGEYVVKIFAPAESGYDQTSDMLTEAFATRRAGLLGVSAPKVVADGYVEDKYRFAYIVYDYIGGAEFRDAVKTMSFDDKVRAGARLRGITDMMNTPCGDFNGIDVIGGEGRFPVWERFPERFKAERLAYKRSHDFGLKVFVHGDLCGDNALVQPDGGIYLIDFADAMLAPLSYEHSLAAFELLGMDTALLFGYFGDYDVGELTDICFDGLLMHINGGGIIRHYYGDAGEFAGLADLRKKLHATLSTAKQGDGSCA